jgi:hypothetical protein
MLDWKIIKEIKGKDLNILTEEIVKNNNIKILEVNNYSDVIQKIIQVNDKYYEINNCGDYEIVNEIELE